MFAYNTMGAQPGYAQAHHGGPMARVGRYYDIVGQNAAPPAVGTWQSLVNWGNTPTLGIARKWLVLGAVVLGVTWYGYHARWF